MAEKGLPQATSAFQGEKSLVEQRPSIHLFLSVLLTQ